MKKISILLFSIILENIIFILSAVAEDGPTPGMYSTTTHEVGATVFNPLSIVSNTSLNFGSMITSDTAGSVTVTTSGVNTEGGVTVYADGTAGQLTISGTPQYNDNYAAIFVGSTPPTQLVHESDSNATMSLSNMTIAEGTPSEFEEATNTTFFELPAIDSSGTMEIHTVGTLNVGANQKGGRYTATWPITVYYAGI